ncbi:MAG: sulfotransferase domain-containing protein, partial [Patescibacteria group bacterium]
YKNFKEYESLNNMDRIVATIEKLFQRYEKAEKEFSVGEKKKILFLRYEDILGRTGEVIKKIQKFLNKKPLKEMGQILKREKLPNREYSDVSSKKQKIAVIKARASARYFNKLMVLENKYFKDAD